MNEQERRMAAAVDAWAALHRDELIADLMELVSIRSVAEEDGSGYPFGWGCKLAADKLMALGAKHGFAVENDDYFCVTVMSPGQKSELGILGHLDIVPEGGGWRHPPFKPTLADGYMIGRGTSDCKGPLVMGLYVLRCIRELQLPLKSALRLIAGCDEETGMTDVLHYQQVHRLPDYTLNCDGAWPVGIGEKGIFTANLILSLPEGNLIRISGGSASNTVPDEAFAELKRLDDDKRRRITALCADAAVDGTTIRVKGLSAHAGTPERGNNAILKLLTLLCEADLLEDDEAQKADCLRKCFPDCFGTGLRIQHEDRYSKTTCIPSIIRCENKRITLHINVRSAVTQSYQMLLNNLQKRCSRLGICLENASFSPPRMTSVDEPEVQILLNTCEDFLPSALKPYVAGGGTHSRVFPRSIPFGPGFAAPRMKRSFGGPHTADEAVLIDDLLLGIRIYVMALLRLDAYFYPDSLA